MSDPTSSGARGPVHRLSRADARRIAVRAQRLGRDRPRDVIDTVRQLTLLQIQRTSAVAPSADLVLCSRLGRRYHLEDLDRALTDGELFYFRGTIRPVEEVPYYRAEMAAWPGPQPHSPWQKVRKGWVEVNDAFRLDVLRRLERDGPLVSREIPDSAAVPWRSSGWSHGNSVRQMLQFMEDRGEIAVAGYRGADRVWDVAERVYPDGPTAPWEEAESRRNAVRLNALGIARSRGPECAVEPLDVGYAGEAAVVEGVSGEWRIDPVHLEGAATTRTALLSPFDRLLHDRKRMAELFDFDYALEMYKPAARRRWGYYALPILHRDRLVGKLDSAADIGAGTLRINTWHWDSNPSATLREAAEKEAASLADVLGLELISA